MHYVTVFDASHLGLGHFWPIAVGLLFVVIGLVQLFARGALAWLPAKARFGRPFAWLFLLFAIFWTGTVSWALIGSGFSARAHALRRDCTTVEGPVEHFHPMPSEGHDPESFEVAGQRFEYSDFVMSAGFNTSASHGGPIREGLPVRICHRGGDILILEVAR
jgi:hypothetical protein